MPKTYLAHTTDGNGNKITCNICGKCESGHETCHSLKDHLAETSVLAREKAEIFGAGEIACILALCHDLGKYSDDFQDKLRGKNQKAYHAMYGADVFSQKYQTNILSKLLSIIIASHHTGLMDFGNDYEPFSFLGKLKNTKHKDLPYQSEINLPDTINHNLRNFLTPNSSNHILGFQVATYIRMLFSVLVDSDFTNTEEFCKNIKRKVEHDNILDLYEKLKARLPQNDGSKLNNIRAEILKNCIDKADSEKGLFTLTVPTGGGKTLSSLAFALKHVQKHNLRRVIYVIPYTTIIEQNAKIIKDILGEKNVLEHHSNIQNEDDNDNFQYKWATENWDIPIVITTNVQFFESLFSHKTTQLRKIHNIINSVIIFDEAQMLPTNYLSPCMTIISELIKNYGCSAVLCSATQPTIHKYVYKNLISTEIAENIDHVFNELKRVEFVNLGKQSDEDIIDDILCTNTSTLIVVNTRKHAFHLYQLLTQKFDKNNVFYLSTLLIPLHRSNKINEIKNRLLNNELTIVVSTQLIEAGVDIDFPVVYKSLAGIDSIIQAGGRANREGKLIQGLVKIYESTSEYGKIPNSLRHFAELGREALFAYKENAFNLEGIKKYFELYYAHIEQDDLLDKNKILQQFQVNNGEFTDCNFKTAFENFKLIDDITKSIVIDCQSSNEIITKLRNNNYNKADLRKLQLFSINIYPNELQNLINDNAIENINGIYVLITNMYYNDDNGLDIFTDDNKNAECYVL